MKKLFACFFSILLSISLSFSVYAKETPTEKNLSRGTLLATPESILIDHLPADNSVVLIEENDTLPLSVDNSSSNYFPTIGNQGSYGSCGVWTGVYYMYTYEVNRLHNTAAVTNIDGIKTNISTNVYSPSWAYSVMTSDPHQGTALDWIFDFTIAHGQQTLSTLPYYSESNPYPCFLTDRSKIVEALTTRVSSWKSAYIDTTMCSIKNTNCGKLNEVKNYLQTGMF